MNIYIAGNEIERARAVGKQLEAAGHRIAYKWYDSIENEKTEDAPQIAHEEREAVRSADALVYLWQQNQESARFEAGMAMALGTPIVVSGYRDAFFFHLPEIDTVERDTDVAAKLDELFG